MSIKIIQRSRVGIEEFPVLNAYRKDTNELCYGFPIFKNGRVEPCIFKNGDRRQQVLCPEETCSWWFDYQMALFNDSYVLIPEKESRTVIYPAKARCYCGKVIELNTQPEGTSHCEACDRWYDAYGQECLNPLELILV